MPHQHPHSTNTNIKAAFFLNFCFTIIEIIGGILTNSTAILADAIHDLGDTFALGQAWYFENLTAQKGSRKYSYGYKRFSLLGALVSTVMLLGSSLYVLSEAIPRLIVPQHPNAQGMVLLAMVGVLVNGYAIFKLDSTDDQASINVKVIALHLLEDVLGWMAVLIVAIVLLFKDIHILDPILAILITLYILNSVVKNFRQIVPVFLQATPKSINMDTLLSDLEAIPLVSTVHHVHVWSMDGQHHVLTAHLAIEADLNINQLLKIKENAKAIIERYHFFHSTVELEHPEELCRIADNEECH